MARTVFTENPPEQVPWAEYQAMVWQRDDFRDQTVELEIDRDGWKARAERGEARLTLAEERLDLANDHCEQLEGEQDALKQELEAMKTGVRAALHELRNYGLDELE